MLIETEYVLDVLSYSDWEDGEATPHSCSIFAAN
jgi:hypothetical protein